MIDAHSVVSKGGVAAPTIRFSSFGHFASITSRELVPDSDFRLVADFRFIVGHLRGNGFAFVAASELDASSDGGNAPNNVLPTWWARHFDWL